MNNRLVSNEPHASVDGLYDADKSFWHIDTRFLNDVIIKWTDWHTDFLFHRLQDSRIELCAFRMRDLLLTQNSCGTIRSKILSRSSCTRTLRVIGAPFLLRRCSLFSDYRSGTSNDSGMSWMRVHFSWTATLSLRN